MKYDPEKHHRRSIRLPEYDYASAGYYFVTICAQNRECLFGEIVNTEIHLNEYGKIVTRWWQKIPLHFGVVQLDQFVLMPNHLHGIIVIVEDRRGGMTPPRHRPSLGQIIAYFKYQSTKQINQLRKTPTIKLWQRNYFERIIRNDKELHKIREYILYNPLKWAEDKENPENLTT